MFKIIVVMMSDNGKLSKDKSIDDFEDLSNFIIKNENEIDDTFNNITFNSQIFDTNTEKVENKLPSTLEYQKYYHDKNHSDTLYDVAQEDVQWNEQTWLPELSTNVELISNITDIDISNWNFNSFVKSEGSLKNNSLSEATIFNDDSFCISQSKLSSMSYSDKLKFDSKNKIIVEEKKENTFYGLPNKVKILIQKIKNITNLYEWQDECLNLESVKKRQNLIYALPTSGGKTLVAEILMLREIVCNKKNVIFVLPYVAIVQEKIQSMTPFALHLGFLLEEYAGGKGKYPPIKRHRKNSIFICTIEKASSLINSLIENNRLNEIGLVVIDELHLIGEGGGRGATLESFLTKLMYINESIHIVGMSATIGNLNEIAAFLNATIYTKNFRPVQLKEYVKCENKIWLIDLHTDEIFTDEKKINYCYSEAASKLDPDRIGGLVMDVVPKDSCLIFCSSRKNCENVALLMTRVLFKSLKEYKKEEKDKLLKYLKAEGNLCPILSQTIRYGVTYHHSGLTAEERRLLEDAYRAGTISVICCTTTLAAGVNLPARRVILRSPYIGNEFLNLSRYKQMIGRAGRAGMGEIGESILICKSTEITKIHGLLTSKLEDCLSNLITDEDRGINNLILSSVMLSIATTRTKLHELVSKSLLNIQSSQFNIKTNDITDSAIIKLMKDQVLNVKKKLNYHDDMTIVIPSQIIDSEINNYSESPVKKRNKQSTIKLTKKSILELSDLGRASLKASIDLKTAYNLCEDLKMAQNHLILINDLHILYLVTPYDLSNQLKPNGSIYYDIISNLSSSSMTVARLLGINEVTITKLRDGLVPKNIEPRVINRFYLTLILYDLWQQESLHIIADKYQVNRGAIQNLLISAASFTMSVVRFCQELPEFWAFTELLMQFNKKLTYGCTNELEILMELPAVKVGRAKQLYDAGYKTLQSIASADAHNLIQKVNYLSLKLANQMIAAANLLLVAKMENLKDEVAEMMEGLDMSQFSCN